VNIAEYGQVELNVTGMRDHSYGVFSIRHSIAFDKITINNNNGQQLLVTTVEILL